MNSTSPSQTPTAILGVVLCVTPLLFGAVYPWAYGLLEIGILAAFLLSLRRRPRAQVQATEHHQWGLIFLLGFVALAGVQLIPLPSGLVKLLAEPIYRLWQLDFLPATVPHPRAFVPMTLYPFATASTGILFLCYLLAFCLAGRSAQFFHSKINLNVLFLLIVFTGFAVAAVGIVQKSVDAKAIYGFFSPQHSGSFTGPYVNYNHFAGYLELAIPMGVSVIAFAMHSRNKTPAASNILWICTGAVIIMAAAMFMSRSRGGILSFCLIALCQLLTITALLIRGRMRGHIVFFGLLFLIILGTGAYITDWSRTAPRFNALFQQDPASTLRWRLYKDVFQMGNQLPLSGSGLGTFAVGYPYFKTILRQGLFPHAHNDYLEILAETGWLGLSLFLGFVAWVLWRGGGTIIRVLFRQKRSDPAMIGRALLMTGCLGGMLSLLAHGWVDSNLRIPANALTWFVLCGLAVGLSRYTGENTS